MNTFWTWLGSTALGAANTSRTNDKSLRVLIGVLGGLLAPLCWAFVALQGVFRAEVSISHYYHTLSRDVFVGVLFLVGAFLLTYRGHQVIDTVVTSVLGVLAWGVAAFPCRFSANDGLILGVSQLPSALSDHVHVTVAFSFFVLLTLYVLIFFTRGDGQPTPEKRRKNAVFWFCGIGMAVLLVLLGVLTAVYGFAWFDQTGAMFPIEWAFLTLFAVAWLVKANIVPGLVDPETLP